MSRKITHTVLAVFAAVSCSSTAAYLVPNRAITDRQGLSCPSMENGQFSHPTYCDLFLNCWEGQFVVEQCTPGLVFNQKTAACDYPQNVDCEGRGSSQPPLQPSEFCPQLDGRFPNQRNCSEFVVCQGGSATLYACPDGLHYNSEFQICVHQRDSNCLQMPQVPPPASGTPTDPTNPDNGPSSPNPPAQPPGSQEPEAPLTPEPTPTPPPTDIDQVIWPAWPNWPTADRCPVTPGLIGFYPVMGSCYSMFIACSDGVGYLFACPLGESLNLVTGRCSPSPEPVPKGCMQQTQPVNYSRGVSPPRSFGNPFGGASNLHYYPFQRY